MDSIKLSDWAIPCMEYAESSRINELTEHLMVALYVRYRRGFQLVRTGTFRIRYPMAATRTVISGLMRLKKQNGR